MPRRHQRVVVSVLATGVLPGRDAARELPRLLREQAAGGGAERDEVPVCPRRSSSTPGPGRCPDRLPLCREGARRGGAKARHVRGHACERSAIGWGACGSWSNGRGTKASCPSCSGRQTRRFATPSTCVIRAGTGSRSRSPRRAPCGSAIRAAARLGPTCATASSPMRTRAREITSELEALGEAGNGGTRTSAR